MERLSLRFDLFRYRQLGLNNVIEDYILFLDQDDFLYDNYVIENYLNILQETQYDIIEG